MATLNDVKFATNKSTKREIWNWKTNSNLPLSFCCHVECQFCDNESYHAKFSLDFLKKHTVNQRDADNHIEGL